MSIPERSLITIGASVEFCLGNNLIMDEEDRTDRVFIRQRCIALAVGSEVRHTIDSTSNLVKRSILDCSNDCSRLRN